MQEFSSFTGITPAASFANRVGAVASSLDHLPEVPLDLSAVEGFLQTLISNQALSGDALLSATRLNTEKMETLIREAVRRNLQLALQTGEEFDSTDVDLEMGERQ